MVQRGGRVPLGRLAAPHFEGDEIARLEGVGYSFDGAVSWSLSDVTLSLSGRERVCVMGANGSGKSTLALVLSGLRAPDVGDVRLMGRACFVDGAPEGAAYAEARRNTGLVFQDPGDQIVAGVVADDVAFGPENLALPAREIRLRVARELDRVGAIPLAWKGTTELSGGQTQRVAIASAMAMEPALMVFDEASAFLDVRAREALRRLAGRLQGVCAQVWVSHDVEDAVSADRLIVLEDGRVAFDGAPGGLLSDAARLSSLGLEPPFWLRLDRALREAGWPLPSTASEADLVRALAARLSPLCAKVPQSAGTACAPSARRSVFEASGLGFSYATGEALHDVRVRVGEGELVCVVGATGSGKTTLMRLLAGLVAPGAGSLAFKDIDLSTARGRRASSGRIGFVMQQPERQLFATTVAEDVAFGPTNLGLPEDEVVRRVEGALRRLGISELAERSPFELSGGQRRLVALAGVAALEPEAWILDEPLAGLDAKARDAVRALIDEQLDRGCAVVVVTHDMGQAALADRVIALEDGCVVLEGAPAEVFAHAGELEAMGLGLPKALGFAHALGELGVCVGRPLTFEALVGALEEARGA